MGGCLLNPQSKLLPHARASIVSSGRLLFVNDGISVHKIKWLAKKSKKYFLFVFYKAPFV